MTYSPGSPEWQARYAQLLTDELSQPLRWFYLSFADEQFLGAALVEAQGFAHAIKLTHKLGINPGGEVLSHEVPTSVKIPEEAKNRLLSKSDLERFFGPVRKVDPE
jgi:hypothetical protein